MKAKTEKIVIDGFGSYLGIRKGCLIVRNKEGKTRKYPLVHNESARYSRNLMKKVRC